MGMGPDAYDHLPSYARVLLLIDDLYLHIRSVESEVAAYINKSGVTWDQVAELFESKTKDEDGTPKPMTNEGARRHYAPVHNHEPRLPPRLAHRPRGRGRPRGQ